MDATGPHKNCTKPTQSACLALAPTLPYPTKCLSIPAVHPPHVRGGGARHPSAPQYATCRQADSTLRALSTCDLTACPTSCSYHGFDLCDAPTAALSCQRSTALPSRPTTVLQCFKLCAGSTAISRHAPTRPSRLRHSSECTTSYQSPRDKNCDARDAAMQG